MKHRSRMAIILAYAVGAIGACGLVAVAGVRGAALLGLRAPAPPILWVPVERGAFVRVGIADGYLRAVKATPINVPPDLPGSQRVAMIVENGAHVAAGELVLQLDPTTMQRDLADGQIEMSIVDARSRGARARTESQKGSLLLDAELAERELEQRSRFQRRDERIYSRHELIESEIDKDLALAQAENARRRSQIVEEQGKTELELLEIERAKAELQIRQAERGLSSLTVQAPHDGMLVLERNNWRGDAVRVGTDVWPGQKLAEIPDPSKMQAKCYLLEADAAGLATGRLATLIVESRPNRRFAARVGAVDALAKKRVEDVPVQYFEVTIVPDQTDPESMKPGQRVRAEIELDRIDDALSIPRQAIIEREGKSFVWRRQGGGFELVEVTLGARSLARSVVLTGLKEGDEVALGDPSAARPRERKK